MRELWTFADEAALTAFTEAARGGDVFEALLAAEAAPEAARAQARATVADLARQVGGRLEREAPEVALAAVLGEAAGLHSPAGIDPIVGSQPTRVLADRAGLPLAVSVVWMAVGRAAGLRIRGVGLPGYFVVRLVTRDGQRLLDPGRGGRELSEADCRGLVRALFGEQVAWRPEFLRAVTPAALLTRALNNVLNAHAAAGDAPGRYRMVRFLVALHPRTPAVHLLHARVAQEVGAVRLAGSLFEQVAERFPNTSAGAAATRERSALGELPPLH